MYSLGMFNSGEKLSGISYSYDEPESPEIVIDTEALSPEQSAKIIVNYVKENFIKF